MLDEKNIDVVVADDGEFFDWMRAIEEEAMENLKKQGIDIDEKEET